MTLLPLRPASSPDYYILGISGKCFKDDLDRSCLNLLPASVVALNTKNNYNYLESRGTLEAVAQAVRTNGWTVQVRSYAASLEDRVNTGTGATALHHGFLTFVQDLKEIAQRDIQGVRNPSKIILIAHSHGTVWSHLFTKLNPGLPVEVQVDLDGVCADWATDNKGDFERLGLSNVVDFGALCSTLNGQGGNLSDVQNIVYGTVWYDLDVHSNDRALFDHTENHRPDGQINGVFSAAFGENHGGVTFPGSSAMNWVTQSVSNLTRR